MKKIFLFVFLISPFFIAQTNPSSNYISVGRITLNDLRVIQAKSITILSDEVSYYLNVDPLSQLQNEKLENILKIEKSNSGNGGIGALIGGAVGGLVGLVITLTTIKTNTSTNSFVEEQTTTVNTLPISIGAIVGTAIGFIIGDNINSWTTVYSRSAISQ
jgi:hypothetical protein